jgi:AcrR family transcriptional regulator
MASTSPSPKERREARKQKKRERAKGEILEAAMQTLLASGVDGFTVDAVAQQLGITKPAIYYYFKSKKHLLQGIVSASIEEECDVLCQAAKEATDGAAALGDVIRAFVAHHRPQLDRFRLMYLGGQVVGIHKVGVNSESIKELIHPHTTRFYDALEGRLLEDRANGRLSPQAHPRRLAVNAHCAAVGLMTMFGIAESAGDPLKHSDADLIDEMARAFAAAAATQTGG